MARIFTAQGEDGRSLPFVQPVPDSVAGSPFTVGAASVATPELESGLILLHTDQDIHVRFDGADADSGDLLVPAGLHHFPVSTGDVLAMIQDSAQATVHVEQARVL